MHRFVEIAAAAGDDIFEAELKISSRNKVAPCWLLLALKSGLLVHAYLLLHDRIGDGAGSNLQKYYDADYDEPLASMWKNLGAELRVHRTRLSHASIALGKMLSDDTPQSLYLHLSIRSAGLVAVAPNRCGKFTGDHCVKYFDEYFKSLEMDLEAVDVAGIKKLADKTPVDTEELKTQSKSKEARSLYAAYKELEAGIEAFVEFGAQYDRRDSFTNACWVESKVVVSIFCVTQALWRKLKPGETRAEIAITTSRNISDFGGSVPPALRLLLDNACCTKTVGDRDQ